MYFGHVAMYTDNLKAMTDFYCGYFGGTVFYDDTYGDQHSVYIAFDQDCYLVLMDRASIPPSLNKPGEEREGLTHIALNAESISRVNELTAQLEKDGYTVIWQPTDYGTDRFYESCVLDPDGNRVEICVHEDVIRRERGLA